MIEAMKQAIDYIENVPDDRDNVGHIDRKSLALSLRQAIAGLESQEPVALETVYETIIQWDEGGGKRSRRDLARRIIDLYTHPPQRTWVGLTKDEVDSWNLPDHPTVFEFAQFIEAKLKEKNND